MAEIAALAAAVALAAVAGAAHAMRRRRRDLVHRPMVLATPGGRAFAANVGSLSDFGTGLELPRRK